MPTKLYYMYVLLCADGSFYCGFTDDVQRRFRTHQRFKGAKYTRVKARHPLRLLYQEAFADKSAALAAEYRFKHQSRRAKEKFLHMRGVRW